MAFLYRKLFLLVLLGCFACLGTVCAQITEAQARDMLAQRGIPEDTLRARLLKKGIDPDNIAPSQVQEVQGIILETIQEIESDQAKSIPPAVAKPEVKEPEMSSVPETQIIQPPVSASGTESLAPGKTPIYGQEIFRNNSYAVYQKSEGLIVPDSYILDAGDKIGVIGFGRSQFEEILDVDDAGFVQSKERLPRILLKGVKWVDAKEILFQRYNQYNLISRSEFQVTLVKPRNMTVNVVGEVNTTGAFSLPGINTAINVISAAGGPTEIGSVRRIKIIRGAKTIPVDIYAVMVDPSVADQYYLQNNDFIHIPVAEKVVTIQGAVVRPMAYELLPDENLVQLIRFAGGSLPEAYLSDIQVTRFLEDRKVVTNVNLKELQAHGGDYILLPGDVINIKRISVPAVNKVSISGAVVFPGDYENKPGMRVSDLLNTAVLKPDARLDFAFLLQHQADATYKYARINLGEIVSNAASPDNFLLGNLDKLQVMALPTYADPGYFRIEGAVKQPNQFIVDPDGRVRVEDAVLLAGGLKQDASDFGYLIRNNPKEPKKPEYLDINIREALDNPASSSNLQLQSGDVLRVFDKASRRDNLFVSVSGAIRAPGRFEYAPGMSVVDLINLAGGMTFNADRSRIEIARVNLDNQSKSNITQRITTVADPENQAQDKSELLMPFDQVYVRSIPEFELQQTVRIEGEVRFPGMYALTKDKERLSDLLSRAGGLTGEAFPEGAKLYRQSDSTGLVVIDLKEALQNPNAPSNIVLLSADVIHIPKSKDLVTIGGYVNLDQAYSSGFLSGEKSISVAFRGPKRAKYYINKFAAGISPQGSPSDVKVQYADGRIQKSGKFLFFNSTPKVQRGSKIIVGAKPVKTVAEKEQKKTDWSAVLRDTLAQTTAVLTLLILVDQLSK